MTAMSWICVGCSEQESDDSEMRGFGLCKECQLKARKEKAALGRKAKADMGRKFRSN